MPKKILVIEDEATQVLLLTTRLREERFEAIAAMTGEEGLRKAVEEHPDLILLDIILPGMSGIELCQQLKERADTKKIPIILVTASGMRDIASRCKVFGAEACLVKPYHPQELLACIQRVFEAPPAQDEAIAAASSSHPTSKPSSRRAR